MAFQERRLRLQLPGTGRALDANYSDDFEPVLLDHPRDLIQIHGNVIYDDEGRPRAISDVDEILEVDDSAIVVNMLTYGNRSLKAKSPLTFEVSFDPDTLSYQAEGPFDVFLCAETRPQLEASLDEEVAMLWREYALADIESLTPAAQALRERLLVAFEEANDAA